MVREDVAGFVDDEAGSGAAPRPFALPFRRTAEAIGAVRHRHLEAPAHARPVARRRVDIDDGRVEPLGDVGERARQRARRRRGCGPQRRTVSPGRRGLRRRGHRRAGDDQTDEKRDRRDQADRHDEESPSHCEHYRPQGSGISESGRPKLGFVEHRDPQRLSPSRLCCPPLPRQ